MARKKNLALDSKLPNSGAVENLMKLQYKGRARYASDMYHI